MHILLAAALACAVCARAGDEARDGDLRKLAVSVKASSCEAGHDAALAFDDDLGTRWSSEWTSNQWIAIDLGTQRVITEIGLAWEKAHALDYRIEAADDGGCWRTIQRVPEGQEGEEVFRFDDLEARHLRVYAHERATPWGFSLREFVVRGPAEGYEPEFGGVVRPRAIATVFDHDLENLSRRFAEERALDPTNSSALSDDAFLDLLERAAFNFFWYEVHPETLFIVDSTTWKERTSNAGIGFQLGAYIAGHYRGYRPQDEIYERVERLLDNCWDDPADPGDLCIEHHDGWTYHWVDIVTGKWRGEEHICTHDSITYLCGVIAAKHYFAGTRAGELAARILDGVKWDWIIHGGRNEKFVSNCYAPTYDPPCGGEVRFYDGMKFDYLLPIGGDPHPIDPMYWHNYALDFPWDAYRGRFWRIERPAPWCHQWDSVWFDFRYMKDDYADYHQNSVEATLANRQWCIDHRMYNADLWGLGPSHGPAGDGVFYGSYGAPPDDLPFQKGIDNDGTISPSAFLPSILFAPKDVLRVARFVYDTYRDRFWRRYGFPDALNPSADWFDREYIGIDQGPIVINIENYRSGLLHDCFAREEIVWKGLRRAGFVGIVDTFDPSEHSPPYGAWRAGAGYKLERATDVVKEGRRSLRVRYDAPAESGEAFFAVRQERKDCSPYRFLAFWVCEDPGLTPVLVAEGGEQFPLVEKTDRNVAQGWTRRYFEIPEAARSGRVEEVRFTVAAPAEGTCWLDDIVLTHEIPPREQDFVIDDFDVTRARWLAPARCRLVVVSNAVPEGSRALRVDCAGAEEPRRWTTVALQPGITNWSRFSSVALWARGNAVVRLRLTDGAGRSFDVGTRAVAPRDGWKHLFFNIQANLNPSNCWEPRYDKRDIRRMSVLFKPGEAARRETVCLDGIVLTE